jgi:hypothetical protein
MAARTAFRSANFAMTSSSRQRGAMSVVFASSQAHAASHRGIVSSSIAGWP